jgi:outer membrane protein
MKKLMTVITLGLVIAMVSPAYEAAALTMEEAVTFALQNNHRVKQFERLEYSAREDVGVKESAFWPSADLSYSYTDVETSGGSSLFNQDGSVGTAELSYNLFNGLSDLNSLKESRAMAEASSYEADAVAADVVLGTKTAYIGVLRARRDVETAGEGVELLEHQAEDARRFYDVGLFAKNDLLKVEVELASARQDLITAEGNLVVARKGLERTMGQEIVADEVISDIEDMPTLEESSYEVLSEEALQRRSELRQLNSLQRAYGYGANAAKGGYLPRIDVSLSHSRYGDNAGLDGRASQYDDEDRVMLSATWNIFSGFSTKHGVAQARYQQEAAQEQLKDTEAQVMLQLKEAIEGYGVARGRLEAAETAVEQAEENYRVTENQFKERLATTTDLLDARFYLTRARSQMNNALYDVHLWTARIERAVEGYSVEPAAEAEEVHEAESMLEPAPAKEGEPESIPACER